MDIEASTKVGDILQDHPELTDWFMEMGLCGCGTDSDLMWTLKRLAEEKSMDLAVLLDEINNRIN